MNSSMDVIFADPSITNKERLDYVWKHFALIADQRVKTFNFYIIVLGGAVAATITLMHDPIPKSLLNTVGYAHLLIAAAFCIFDLRAYLILRAAKAALREAEVYGGFSGSGRLFINEHAPKVRWGKLSRLISYSTGFWALFAAHAYFGLKIIFSPASLGAKIEFVEIIGGSAVG